MGYDWGTSMSRNKKKDPKQSFFTNGFKVNPFSQLTPEIIEDRGTAKSDGTIPLPPECVKDAELTCETITIRLEK